MKNQPTPETLSEFLAESTKFSEHEILELIPTYSKLTTLYSTLRKVLAIKSTYSQNALIIKNNIHNIIHITSSTHQFYIKISPDVLIPFIKETEEILKKLTTLQNQIIETINNATTTENYTIPNQEKYLPEERTYTDVVILHFINKSTILIKNPTLINIIEQHISKPIESEKLNYNKNITLIEVYAKTADNQSIILSDDAVVNLLNNPKLIKKEHIFITSQRNATSFKEIKKFIINYNYRPYLQHLSK